MEVILSVEPDLGCETFNLVPHWNKCSDHLASRKPTQSIVQCVSFVVPDRGKEPWELDIALIPCGLVHPHFMNSFILQRFEPDICEGTPTKIWSSSLGSCEELIVPSCLEQSSPYVAYRTISCS